MGTDLRTEDVQHDGPVDAFSDNAEFVTQPDAAPAGAEPPAAPEPEAEAPPEVDWSLFGPDGPDLAAKHGWTNPQEGIEYFRAADAERGRLRNELGETRSQNKQLADLIDSFTEPPVEDQPAEEGMPTVEWEAVEAYAREPVPHAVRVVVDQVVPQLMQMAVDRAKEELRAEFRGELEPVQRYVGTTAVKSEVADLARQYPDHFPLVGDRVGELIMAEPQRYSRPGGMKEAFERAVAERALSGAGFGQPAAPPEPAPPAPPVGSPPAGARPPGPEADLLAPGQTTPPMGAPDVQQIIREQIMGMGRSAGGDAFS